MKKLDTDFFKLSGEEQAKLIERETAKLIKRLPDLKKHLKMYGEVSDELYNLTEEEVKIYGETYSRAVRGGEITTPSSKRAYQKFIRDLRKYTSRNVRALAIESAETRLESWLQHIEQNGSMAEIEYAKELIAKMTDSQKIGFTTSSYFLDTENWSSQDFMKDDGMGNEYSIQTLKLELYLQTYGEDTRNIYNTSVASDGQNKLRGGYRGQRAKRRSK